MYISFSAMYICGVYTVSAAQARKVFSEVIDRAKTEAVVIERRGEASAVILSPERYEQLLEAYEEQQDIAAFDEAMAEEGANIPWEQVKQDLGWA